MSFHYESRPLEESPIEARVKATDHAFFRDHPERAEYVRRVVPGEYNPQRSRAPGAAEVWEGAEWVLVQRIGRGKSPGRLRTPLTRAGMSFND
ncbi:MAG: hypothetical protein J2P17_30410 [Mycobacterium sp.]|nr:hypothetical protein [Mycobacterium sp.]